MLKLIYLAKRKPGFTFDQFVRRWRMHGARGMEQSLWEKALGYVQAEPILPPPFASASSEYDAVASFILRDDAFDVPPIREEGAAMAADELRPLRGPSPWSHSGSARSGSSKAVWGGTRLSSFLRIRWLPDARRKEQPLPAIGFAAWS
jgi:hypothetical protein